MASKDKGDTEGAKRPPMPRWKKLFMGLAGLLVLSGVGLRVYAEMSPQPEATTVASSPAPETASSATTQTTTIPMGSNSFLPDGFIPSGIQIPRRTSEAPGTSTTEPPAGQPTSGETTSGGAASTAAKVSPFLLESGLSFFLAFCVATAIRAAAKFLAILIGVLLLGVFGLQYMGAIPPIDWSQFQGWFTTAATAVQGWMGWLNDTLLHGLPSGTMAGLGLAAGFKKS